MVHRNMDVNRINRDFEGWDDDVEVIEDDFDVEIE